MQNTDENDLVIINVREDDDKNNREQQNLLDKLNDFVIMEQKIRISNKVEVRKQFKHGLPNKLNQIIVEDQKINNSSPSYKAHFLRQ